MASIIIADSGSTKTDWVWMVNGKRRQSFQTSGINPLIQDDEAISASLQQELPWGKKNSPDRVVFYGAGVNSTKQEQKLARLLKVHFGTKEVLVHSDMLAAAHSLCGHNAGVVCILGTGSNSGYYNGKKIAHKMPSLGYIAGDEGSGNHMGKKVLRHYMYNIFEPELALAFEQRFGHHKAALIEQLYQSPFPNRFLAHMVSLLVDFRGYYMIENIIEDSLSDFFERHVLKYRQTWQMPVHFMGSVAYEFKDVIEMLCMQYEIECGLIVQKPMPGLIAYYKA